jgi:uncharacterized phiE125 gp8 family phage protein
MVSYNAVLDIQFNDSVIVEPVTLTEAKDFCKVDIGTDDAIITSMIIAARQMCEGYTNIGFVPHIITAIVNNENGSIYIPYGPIVSIEQVKNDLGKILVQSVDYEVSGNEFKRLLYPEESNITIDYNSGYTDLPAVLKLALLNQVYYLYDNRSQGVDNISPIAQSLLNLYKRV